MGPKMAGPQVFPGDNVAPHMDVQPQRPSAQIGFQAEVFGSHALRERVIPAHFLKDIQEAHVEIDGASFGQVKGEIANAVKLLPFLLGVAPCEDQRYEVGPPVVADKVQDGEKLLVFCLAQPPPRLLQEDGIGFGGPQEHDQINFGDIHPFVELIHREDHFDLAPAKCFHSRFPFHGEGPFAAVNRCRRNAMLAEKLSHEVGMPDTAAKTQGPREPVFQVVLKDQITPVGYGKRLLQLISHVAPVGHGYFAVIGGVIVIP